MGPWMGAQATLKQGAGKQVKPFWLRGRHAGVGLGRQKTKPARRGPGGLEDRGAQGHKRIPTAQGCVHRPLQAGLDGGAVRPAGFGRWAASAPYLKRRNGVCRRMRICMCICMRHGVILGALGDLRALALVSGRARDPSHRGAASSGHPGRASSLVAGR